VLFFNNSTNAIAYEWAFGDGITSTLTNPSHSYTQVGVYTVTLIAGDGSLTDTLTKTNSITVTAAISLARAFAFGADTWTRTTANQPGTNYIKVVQNGQNFTYTTSLGHGYTNVTNIDATPNNREVYTGPDELYDQFIGAKNSSFITFRVDVPHGRYRFVAAGGDAVYFDHSTTIEVQDGVTGPTLTLVSNYIPTANGQFWTVDFDDKVVPPADGVGAAIADGGLSLGASSPCRWGGGQPRFCPPT
jgi:PKD repeat protein